MWLGGLVILVAVVLPRRQAEELQDLVPRFSRLASVCGDGGGGGTACWFDLAPLARLPTSEYGRFLLQAFLVAGLLAAASRAEPSQQTHADPRRRRRSSERAWKPASS